jgi:hypothetical protein
MPIPNAVVLFFYYYFFGGGGGGGGVGGQFWNTKLYVFESLLHNLSTSVSHICGYVVTNAMLTCLS